MCVVWKKKRWMVFREEIETFFRHQDFIYCLKIASIILFLYMIVVVYLICDQLFDFELSTRDKIVIAVSSLALLLSLFNFIKSFRKKAKISFLPICDGITLNNEANNCKLFLYNSGDYNAIVVPAKCSLLPNGQGDELVKLIDNKPFLLKPRSYHIISISLSNQIRNCDTTPLILIEAGYYSSGIFRRIKQKMPIRIIKL